MNLHGRSTLPDPFPVVDRDSTRPGPPVAPAGPGPVGTVYGESRPRRGSWAWWRRRPALALSASAIVALIMVSGAAHLGLFDAVPLLNPTAAAVIEVCGGAALVASWWWRDRRWQRRTLPLLLLGVTGVTAAIAAGLWLTETVTDAYPPSFGVWIGAAFAAIAACPLVLRRRAADGSAMRRSTVTRRTAAVLAVPLTIVGALLLVDNQYGIWPQVGDLLGHHHRFADVALQKELPGLAQQRDSEIQHTSPRPLPDKGVVADFDAPATTSGFRHRPGMVYLPPAYFGPDGASLPVLMLLIGVPGTPIHWLTAGGAQATADAYAAAHHGVAPVMVVVDQNGSATGDTECVDGPQGNAETYLTVDVPTFIAESLHIKHDPARWGIAGFSAGGTCALGLVLGHPDIYRHLVSLGGDMRPTLGSKERTLQALFGGSVAAQQAHEPAHLLGTRHHTGVTAWLATGADDHGLLIVAQRISAALANAGIVEHHMTLPGGHNWQLARDGFARILPGLCEEMGCAESEVATPTTQGRPGGRGDESRAGRPASPSESAQPRGNGRPSDCPTTSSHHGGRC